MKMQYYLTQLPVCSHLRECLGAVAAPQETSALVGTAKLNQKAATEESGGGLGSRSSDVDLDELTPSANVPNGDTYYATRVTASLPRILKWEAFRLIPMSRQGWGYYCNSRCQAPGLFTEASNFEVRDSRSGMWWPRVQPGARTVTWTHTSYAQNNPATLD